MYLVYFLIALDKQLSSIYDIFSDQIVQMKLFLQKSRVELAQEGKLVLISERRF